MDLIEPDDDASPESRIRDRLLAVGLPPDDVDVCLSLALAAAGTRWWPNGRASNPLSEDARVDGLVDVARDAVAGGRPAGDARIELLCALVTRGVMVDESGEVLRRGPPHRLTPGLPAVDHLLPVFLASGLDVRKAIDRLSGERGWIRDAIIAHPAARSVVKVEEFLDLPGLRKWDRFATRSNADAELVGRPEFWARVHGPGCLEDFLRVVAAEPTETAGRVAQALLHAVAHPVWQEDAPPTEASHARASELLARWCDHLAARVDAAPERVDLLGAYMDATSLLARESRGQVAAAQARQAARIADRALGRLRVLARGEPSAFDAGPDPVKPGPQLAWSSAVGALASFAGLGAALVSGAQLLRALREPAVARDLRWWDEPPLETPPARWRWLPSTLVAVVHSVGALEAERDPELRAARESLARYLLDRLKPSDADGANRGAREPDPLWRRCCIRAVRELDVNPGGRGHRILHNVAESDPEIDVREAARTACEELRRADGSTGDVSPRRRLVAALWWLRQAHLLALGIDVDATGARRTRQVEISRTKEKRKTTV